MDIMVIVHFTDHASERRALGYLTGRFSFKSWANGQMLIPEVALTFLAVEGMSFVVEGPPSYEH
jgi:hypothetical protein